MKGNDEWVPVAEIARSHGVRGEVRLRLFNKDSDVLLDVDEVLVRLPDGEEHEVSVDAARPADGAVLMKLFSVDDRDRADELRGSTLCVKRGDFRPLAAGEFYVCDVEGAAVATAAGANVGVVRDVRSYPSLDVLVVEAPDGAGNWEIPLTDAYVEEVDLEGGRVRVKSLDGLELDKPPAPKPKPERPSPPKPAKPSAKPAKPAAKPAGAAPARPGKPRRP